MPQLGGHPLAGQPEHRLDAGAAGEEIEAVPDGEDRAGRRLATGHLDAADPDGVGGQRQVEVVAGAHRGHDDAQLEGDLAAQRPDPVEQVAAGGVHQVDEVRGERELQRVHPHLAEQRLGGVRGRAGLGAALRDLGGIVVARRGQPLRHEQHRAADDEERQLRQAGDEAEPERGAAADLQRPLVLAELGGDGGAHVAVPAGPGDDQTGGDRQQQRRDLRDQAVADAEQAVRLDRVGRRQVALEHADDEAADQVDHCDHDSGHRVTFDEL